MNNELQTDSQRVSKSGATPRKPLLGMAALSPQTAEAGHYSRNMSPLPARYSGLPSRYGYRMGLGTELQNAKLDHADLRWSNLRGTSLKGATLDHARLWGACLVNADLSGASLKSTDFTGADLVGADLSDADLEGASFFGARYSPLSTRFPRRFGSPEARGMVAVDGYQEIC